MKQIIGIGDVLCWSLQQWDQDFVNAMSLVSTTKSLIQKLYDDGCEPLFKSVKTFCA